MEIEEILTEKGKEFYDYYIHLDVEYKLKNTFEDFIESLKKCENCGEYVTDDNLSDTENEIICLDCKNDGYFE